MVGSWIGRSLAAVPGLLASVAAGAVVAGLTREVALSLAVVALLTGIVLLRVTAIGVTIDLEGDRILLRTFWRTVEISVDDLQRIDAAATNDGWPPGVRFVTTDGRGYSSLALCYLDEDRADHLIAQLEAVAGPSAQVQLDPTSFRPSTS